MRRACAILLTVWISAVLMLPVVLASTDQARVPACCRAAGKHHCSLPAAPPLSAPAWQAVQPACPLWHVDRAMPSQAAAPPAAGKMLTPRQAAQLRLAAPAPAQSCRSFSRSHQKRGPPAFFA